MPSSVEESPNGGPSELRFAFGAVEIARLTFAISFPYRSTGVEFGAQDRGFDRKRGR
jgi:hypothetical protein